MNLHGSIKELQSTIVKLYLDLEQHFSENQLIREMWAAMAHDVAQQIQSLDALPQSFWNQLKKDPACVPIDLALGARHQNIDNKEDITLKLCFDHALCIEEPTILKIYVPLIRRLKENLTEPALDFYIMVKAHLARITRITESFSGDPVIIRRSSLLLQTFEKEVQEPHIEIRFQAQKKAYTAESVKRKEPVKKSGKPAAAKNRPAAKRTKPLRTQTKPMVKKVGIQRRRARR